MPIPLINNRAGHTGLRVQAKSATKAEITIYSAIGDDVWGDGSSFSAKAFDQELKKLDASVNEITVRINSPGGCCFSGITIYNRLKQHKAKKIVYIDGLAASIASIIALAGDEVYMGEGALFMVHLPWTIAMGDRMSMDNTINRLMDVEDQMISIYTKQTGINRVEMKALLEAETWMDADQAVELGFASAKVEETVRIAASALKSDWIKRSPANVNAKVVEKISAAKNELIKKIEATLKARK